MSTLSWETEHNGADLSVTLEGELDLASSKRLEDELMRLEDNAPPLITLDLRGVTFIDSTGRRGRRSSSSWCADALTTGARHSRRSMLNITP